MRGARRSRALSVLYCAAVVVLKWLVSASLPAGVWCGLLEVGCVPVCKYK